MRTTIDNAGRIVIPKRLRDEAGLKPGMELDVRCRDGRIEVEPSEVGHHLERRGRFLVAVANGPVPPLTLEEVDRTIQEIRDERGLIQVDD